MGIFETKIQITLTGSKIEWWDDLLDVGGPVIDEARDNGNGA